MKRILQTVDHEIDSFFNFNRVAKKTLSSNNRVRNRLKKTASVKDAAGSFLA